MNTNELQEAARQWIEQCRKRLPDKSFQPAEAVAFARQWASLAAQLEEQPYPIRHEALKNGRPLFQQWLQKIILRMDELLDKDPDFYYGLERFSFLEKEYSEQRDWVEKQLKN